VKLEEERDFLLRSLRDLEAEHDAGEIDERDYVGLRDEYTARAAAALRALEARHSTLRALEARHSTLRALEARDTRAVTRAGETRAPRSRRTVALVTLGVVGLAVVTGILVAHYSGERVADRPLTGATPPTSPPDDLTRARQLFSERKYLDALKLYDDVLKADPRNVEALAYRGWLLFQASPEELTDRALESLDRAVVTDPRFPDAHFFRGWVLHHGKDDPAAAVPEYRAFLATNPPPEFRQRVEQEMNLALCDIGQAPPGITCAPAPAGR
jgi:tetratricopeptide (TPR) repeat protein